MADIPRTHWAHYTIPRSARPYTSDEKIYFIIPKEMDASNYDVIIEDLSSSWRNLGALKAEIILPNVHFPAHAKIAIRGKNSANKSVKIIGEFRRGGHYVVHEKAGTYVMHAAIHV